MASKGAFRALGNNCWTMIGPSFFCAFAVAAFVKFPVTTSAFNVRIADHLLVSAVTSQNALSGLRASAE